MNQEDLFNNYDIFEETATNKNNRNNNNYKNNKSNKNDKVRVHTPRRRSPKLDFTMLVSDRGLKKVLDDAQKLRFEESSKNNKEQNKVTERNLNKLIGFYQAWAHDLCPKMKFHDFIQKVEILCSERNVMVYVRNLKDEFEKEIEMKNPIINLIDEEEERDDKSKGGDEEEEEERDDKEEKRDDKEEKRDDKEEDMIIDSHHNSTTINLIDFNQNDDDNNNTEENIDKRDNVPPMDKRDTMDTLDAMNIMNIDDDNNSDNNSNISNNNNYDY